MFPETLKKLLKKKDWRPVHLSAALASEGTQVSEPAIWAWLRGNFEPRLAAARAVADAFEVTLDELYPSPKV